MNLWTNDHFNGDIEQIAQFVGQSSTKMLKLHHKYTTQTLSSETR